MESQPSYSVYSYAWINHDCKESISIIPRMLRMLSCHFYTTTTLPSIQPLKPLTPLVMKLHLSSSSHTCFQTYIHGIKTLKQISFGIFLQHRTERGIVDSLGGTVKHSVWRFVKAGGNAPLDTISYSEIAHQHNPSYIFFISFEDIEKKSDEMPEH